MRKNIFFEIFFLIQSVSLQGRMAEWLGKDPQDPLHWFKSFSDLYFLQVIATY
ncbi:MAG: hypothetical protein JWN56_155 [Sphingobacteriales bacterium]|nr:hypothetical protein [Sphingobacteriales bacterium]